MSRIIQTLRLLNAPCRDMTALISRAMDDRLPLRERFAVRLHLLYCRACKQYRRHLAALREALRNASGDSDDSTAPAVRLSPAARARIGRRLNEG